MSQPELPPKTHPALREILPDDPMEMTGFQVPGDPNLMLRLLVEEYARVGWGVEDLLRLARDPHYQAFHGLWRMFGEEELRRRVNTIISRCGVMRVRVKESEPISERLIPLELPIRPF